MLLVLYRARANSDVCEKIGKITVVFGIKHLIGTAKACFGKSTKMQASNGNDTVQKIGIGIGIRLVQHSLISVTCGARLVGINARNDHNFICNLILHGAQARDIIQDRVFFICRARADNKYELIGFAFKNIFRCVLVQKVSLDT